MSKKGKSFAQPSGPVVRLCLITYCTSACWDGWKDRKERWTTGFNRIWDNEKGETEIRNDKGEMTNSREGSAVIRLQSH